MSFVPRGMFLTKGVGRHREELHSFELALRDAGIERSISGRVPPTITQ
jgi:arginine decarboxylase